MAGLGIGSHFAIEDDKKKAACRAGDRPARSARQAACDAGARHRTVEPEIGAPADEIAEHKQQRTDSGHAEPLARALFAGPAQR
jgi:hypothetical protein